MRKTLLFILLSVIIINNARGQNQKVSFSWNSSLCSKNFGIQVTEGKKYVIDWGNGVIQDYEGMENDQMRFHSRTYENSGIYTVTITAEPECSIFELVISVRVLNLKESPSLVYLDCSFN